jgi:hypothetical protein
LTVPRFPRKGKTVGSLGWDPRIWTLDIWNGESRGLVSGHGLLAVPPMRRKESCYAMSLLGAEFLNGLLTRDTGE